jgi:Zn-dependent metalloprotease
MSAARKRAGVAPARAVAVSQLTERQAVARALASVGPAGDAEVLVKELCYFPSGSGPVLSWKIVVQTGQPAAEWKIYLDASTGDIISMRNLLKQASGKGRVFDPNPVAVLNDTSLKDKSPIPMAAYTNVDLRDLKTSGFLDGPFVSTKNTPNRIKRTNRRFLFTRADRAFKEVMVYFHIDRTQRYIQELGFTNALNRVIGVHIDGQKDDNSHYSPTTKSLTFGTGGVDDAEDAEIILHEYGHALQDDQLPGFGASPEGGAMGEGFGDYLAASFFADVKPQVMRPTIGNWDAVAYSGAEPPCLRRLDSNKKYPKDLNGEVHDDGEIWSSCLWEIRSALGRRATDKLVLAHHFLLTPEATFEDGANALLTADTQLNKGQNQQTVRDVFVRRGILPNAKRKNRRSGQPFSQTTPRRPRRSAGQ